jgi:hypothetical protein
LENTVALGRCTSRSASLFMRDAIASIYAAMPPHSVHQPLGLQQFRKVWMFNYFKCRARTKSTK